MKRKWLMRLKAVLLLSICILLIVIPPTIVMAALTKTTTIDEIDAWQEVVEGTLAVGNADSISDSYATVLYVEVALTDANAHSGCTVIIEVSYADDNWMKLTEFVGTAETAATTTINDGAVTAGDTTITLTDATTGDFDVPGRKWFILDGTVGNSESVKTVVNAVHTVTLCQDLLRNHADSLNVYDRVDEWVISIPFGASYVRTLINNTDADCDVHFTTRISKVTALQ